MPVKWFETGAEKLVAIIPIFMIPATTGIMNYGSFFLQKGSIVLLVVVVSTTFVLLISGFISHNVWRFNRRKTIEKGIGTEQ